MTEPSTPTQLSPENLRELAAARLALRKISRAASVAKFDGWTIAIFGALTVFGGIGDGDLMVMAGGAVLCVSAWVELRGAQRLRRLDPEATRLLGFNQLCLASLLALYAIWQLCAEALGHGMSASFAAEAAPLIGADPLAQHLAHQCVIALYLSVLVAAVGGMGGLSRYYFSRGKYVEAYLSQTPAWIINLQKAGVAI